MAKDGRSGLSVVKIAIGIVLALVIMKACDRYELPQAIKQVKIGEFAKTVPAQTQAQRERESEQEGHKQEHAPLEADERCVDGQRFRHAANGWVRNGSC